MLGLPEYQLIEAIGLGNRCAVYRAYGKHERRPVVIKSLRSETPTLDELARLYREYTILQGFEHPGVLRPYCLKAHHNRPVLIVEDIGGRSLKEILAAQRLGVADCLRIGIAITETLDALHQVPILHQAITPSNIIANLETDQIKLGNFSTASRLPVKPAVASDPKAIQGTLPYIAPEQTGCMFGMIDYRADFYSLGVTLYELLTGRLPFAAYDPGELIRCHLSHEPIPPAYVDATVPDLVSVVVMKLLAKSAADRYQSAAGLKADLEACLVHLDKPSATFTPGYRDRRSRLSVPHKLYGRTAEVTALTEALARVRGGNTELILVSGHPGVGKSTLVHSIQPQVVSQGGFFATGTFARNQLDAPYLALQQAFGALIRQVTTDGPQRVAYLRERLIQALGADVSLVAALIPELALLIGAQPAVPGPLGQSQQPRLHRGFRRLVRAFARPEQPLVVVLDDMHWADTASLRLIGQLVTDPEGACLLVIGAYRDDSVDTGHPLAKAVSVMRASDAGVYLIDIASLSEPEIGNLIADAIAESGVPLSPQLEAQTAELAALMCRQTEGNPRFLGHLLDALQREELVRYDAEQDTWCWNTADIQTAGVSAGSLVALLTEPIRRLPEATRDALHVAACIGNRFDLHLVAAVCGHSARATATALWPALQAGFIWPTSDAHAIPMAFADEDVAPDIVDDLAVTYRFRNDRVHHATYTLLSEAAKKRLHYKIGRLLWQRSEPEDRERHVVALVKHLNLGRDLLNDQAERDELAEFNLLAARKARVMMGNAAGLEYLGIGMELLGRDCWLRQRALAMAFHMESLATECSRGKFERVDKLAEVARRYAETVTEQAALCVYEVRSLLAQNQVQTGLETALHALELLQVPLEIEPPAAPDAQPSSPISGSLTTDTEIAYRILSAAAEALYLVDPEMIGPVLITRLHLCQAGASPDMTADAAIDYAILACSHLNQIERGYDFGKHALDLVAASATSATKCSVLQRFYGHIHHWTQPVRESIDPLWESIRVGLDQGDLYRAGDAAVSYCSHLFFAGQDLESIENQCGWYSALFAEMEIADQVSAFALWRQIAWNLLGRSGETVRLAGGPFDEALQVPSMRERNASRLLFMVQFANLLLAYLFGDTARALASAKEAEKYAAGVTGMLVSAEYYFFYTLALLAEYRQRSAPERDQFLTQAVANQERMQRWAQHAPANFEHMYHLVEAEKARTLGQFEQSLEFYGQAIRGAEEQDCVQLRALGCELAAELCRDLGKENAALEYLQDACVYYGRWGAWAKVAHLEARYAMDSVQTLSELPVAPEMRESSGVGPATGPIAKPDVTSEVTASPSAADLTVVIRAAHAISQEVDLDTILERTLTVVTASVDAQRSALILVDDDNVSVAAVYAPKQHNAPMCVSKPVQPPDNEVAEFSPEIILHVVRGRTALVLDDARRDSRFRETLYIQTRGPRSVLCLPLVQKGDLLGVLYLENNTNTGVFAAEQLDKVRLLARQAAISIANARTIAARIKQATQRLATEMARADNAVLEKEAWELARLNVDKDKFFSIISHDLRNPFNMVLNLVDMALEDFYEFSADELQDVLRKLQQAAEGCHNLLENLLTWSRLQSGRMRCKPTAADLRSLAETTMTLLLRTADEKGISLRNDVDADIWIFADTHMIDVVIRNLINNALKFTPRGGEVVISSRAKAAEARDFPGLIEVSVRDTGVGIADDDLDKLFRSDTQHTTLGTSNEQGSGLGLPMCMEMVKQNGGDIRVESAAGAGTTFTFTVPAAAEAPEMKHSGAPR